MNWANFAVRIWLYSVLMLTGSTLTFASNDHEQTLTAQQSDPRVLQWMQGFPPPVDKRITQPDSNFFSFPKLRWSVCHMQELLPTTAVKRHPYQAFPLSYSLVPEIDAITFTPSNREARMTWRDSLAENYTDGLLILHRNKVVYEYYSGCLTPHQPHAAMSMTKSFTGLLAEILIASDQLDEQALASSIIPELHNSAFGDATVRQVMDMTTSLQYSEHYADPNADIWKYSYAANPLPKPPEYDGPIGYFEYLQTVAKDQAHGRAFGYKTVNSDVLGWILARVSGKPFQDLVSEYLWRKIGTENDANITVDALGTAFAGGGLSATLRDLGRIGQLMLDEGKVDGMQVIPKAAVDSIKKGGDKQAFKLGGFSSLPGGSYKSMWWVFHNSHQAFAARGVHGQTIYVDPTAEMVIVRLASHPSAANAVIDPTSLPAYQAVAEYLQAMNRN